jgi:4-alpha-glucanotransferase
MSINKGKNKIIGTVLPLFAVNCRTDRPEANCGSVIGGFSLLEWLAATGQRAWQILPLSQTHLEPGSTDKHVSSPYKGYGVGLDPRYLAGEWASHNPSPDELANFIKEESDWLNGYSLFCAIRDTLGTDDWTAWPDEGLRLHDPEALSAWRASHQEAVGKIQLEQWRLNRAFTALRARAEELEIEILGDLPFYIPLRSPLVWANQECFDLEPDGGLRRVSGVPNGPQSHFGRQVWGHPLYRWDSAKINNRIADLWRLRLNFFSRLYDRLRLDHAKGLFNFGVIDLTDPDADCYRYGPGRPMLDRIVEQARTCGIELFAEDSGDRITELRQALNELEIPGIRILRFAYNEKKKRIEPHFAEVPNYPDNAFAYTSTHDTITLISYVKAMTEAEKRHVCEHIGVTYADDDELLANRMRQALIDSPAGHAMVALQDWFLWPNRINVPGTEQPTDDPNWRWRMPQPIEDLPTELLSHPSHDR